MRRGWYRIGSLVLAVVLAGCAAPPGTGPAVTPAPAASGPVTREPTGLIGSWTVTGPDVPAHTILRLADHRLSVFRACDVLFGGWEAESGGLFLADVDSTSTLDHPGCAAPGVVEIALPRWLARAGGFRAEGAERVLLDDRGAEIARLRPGARPSGGPHLDSSQVEPPTVTDETRRRLAPAVPLPAALTPPAREALVGRWVPATGPGGRPGPAHVTLAADGGWRASDGCTSPRGRWVAGPGGALLVAGGSTTAIGCDGGWEIGWFVTARRVGLDGDLLVLLDAHGAEIGRLRRG